MVGIFVEIEKNKAFTAVVMALVLEDHTSTTLAHKLGRSQGLCGRQLKILERKGWVRKKDPRFSLYTLIQKKVVSAHWVYIGEVVSRMGGQTLDMQNELKAFLSNPNYSFSKAEKKRLQGIIKTKDVLYKKFRKEAEKIWGERDKIDIDDKTTSKFVELGYCFTKEQANSYINEDTWKKFPGRLIDFMDQTACKWHPHLVKLREFDRNNPLGGRHISPIK